MQALWEYSFKEIYMKKCPHCAEEISRNDNELVCMGELLTAGNYSMLTMTVSDWEGELWVQYQAR